MPTTAPHASALDPKLSAALDRLLLSAKVQDHAALRKPPRFHGQPRNARRAARVFELADRWGGRGDRRRLLVEWGVVAGLRLATGTFRSLGTRSVLHAARQHRAEDASASGPVAGYVTSSASENQVLRLSLLLRLMGRHRESVDLLVRRLTSELPSSRCRSWLAHLLVEAGEKKAAAFLAASASGSVVRPARRPHHSRLRYGVVILTMFDSEVFRSSVASLIDSDFEGQIVVVEDGVEPAHACRAFCEELSLTYIKQSAWEGSASAMNAGIAALDPDTDIVTFAHNDVLWPPEWFRQLDRAWDATFDSGRVGLLNLSYVQFKQRKTGSPLYRLFADGAYDDLYWLLTAMADVPSLSAQVQLSHVRAGEQLFGLARDLWNDWTPDLRFMTGRFSVAASFRIDIWRSLGGFDPALPYGFDVELQHHCLSTRRWILFSNNPPLVHLVSFDTNALGSERSEQFGENIRRTYDGFESKYGWHIEHFLNLYFSESAFIYHDEIVRAVNALRFDDVDFVFDDFEERLRERTLANCELMWCRTRARCPYAGPPLDRTSPR